MKSILLKFFYSILLFFYIYNITFVVLPLKTRSIIAVMGIISFIPIFSFKIIPNINYIIHHYFGYAVIIPIMAIVTIVINGSSDYYFLKYFVSLSIFFFSSFFIYVCMKFCRCYSLDYLIDVFVIAVSIQVVISCLMYFNPSFNIYIYNIINNEYIREDVLNEDNRFVGIGLHFFESGAVCGVSLILLAIRIVKNNLNIFYYFVFLLISIGGIFIARTIIIGLLFSFIVIILYGSLKKKVLLFIISIVCAFYMINNSSSIVNNEYSALYDHAFELFNQESDDVTFSTSSTSSLMDMYKNIPQDLSTKTILIGDAKRTDEFGFYYMRTDIGYMRHIYYFGMIGLFFLFLFEYKVTKMAFVNNITKIPIVPILFLYMLIVNLKGEWMLSLSLAPFLFLCIEKNSNEI